MSVNTEAAPLRRTISGERSTEGVPAVVELSNCLPARLSVQTTQGRLLNPPLALGM
jgi:hypothetical protein